MRSTYNESWFRKYFDSLVSSLREVGFDASKIFPWEEFIQSIAEFKVIGLFRAIIALPIALCPMETESHGSMTPDQVWLIASNYPSSFFSKHLKENDCFKKRMLDILMELHDFL